MKPFSALSLVGQDPPSGVEGMTAYTWAITRATALAVAMLAASEGGFISSYQAQGALEATRYVMYL